MRGRTKFHLVSKMKVVELELKDGRTKTAITEM